MGGHATPIRAPLDLFEETDCLPEDAPPTLVVSRLPKRWRATGGEICSLCRDPIPAKKMGYTCSACTVVFCSATCRNCFFDSHVCTEARVPAAAPVVLDVVRASAPASLSLAPVAQGRGGQDGGEPPEVSLDDMLARATSRPALQTMERIPRQHSARGAEIMRDRLLMHAAAELVASRGGGEEARAAALREARLLWIAPALLLRPCMHHVDDGLASPALATGVKGIQRAHEVRRRAQRTEDGDWRGLLDEYLKHVEEADQADAARRGSAQAFILPGQTDDDQRAFQRAAVKAAGNALRSASDTLLGAVHAPLSSATAAAVDELIAAPSPPEELDAQLREVRLAMQLGHAVTPIRHRPIRRRFRMLKLAAQPGPSGWRNAHIQSVGMVSGGVQALAKWATMWQGAAVTSPTASLWTAAIVTPVDCGPAVLEEGEAPCRKLRPIACSEALLKVAESAATDSVQQELLAALEPRQMGCGTPDGTGVIVSTVRSWASTALQRDGLRHSDPEVFESLDLLNAYGRAFRSACIRGARKRAPSLAPMMAAQWQHRATVGWQRCDGAWRATFSTRGGWQGSRLMMVAFCLGLEEGLDAVPFLADVDIKVGRIGYQDDTYLVGTASALNAGNDDLIKALGDVGRTLRATKCAVWTPSWDAEEVDDELPQDVRGLLERYPRHRGGLKLLGSTAHGDLAVDLRDGGVGLGPARARADRASGLRRGRATSSSHSPPLKLHTMHGWSSPSASVTL